MQETASYKTLLPALKSCVGRAVTRSKTQVEFPRKTERLFSEKIRFDSCNKVEHTVGYFQLF